MKEIFQAKKCGYDLRNNNLLIISKTYTQSFGQKSISFRGAVLWNNLSLEIKEANNLESFKHLIKQWGAKTCNCIHYVCIYYVISAIDNGILSYVNNYVLILCRWFELVYMHQMKCNMYG